MNKILTIFNSFLAIILILTLNLSVFASSATTYKEVNFDTLKKAGSVNNIVIANKKNPLPKNYGSENSTAKAQMQKLIDTAKKDKGYNLAIFSGFRSYDTQVTTYNSHLANNGGDKNKTDRLSARAGYSEHQTGLAYDIRDTSVSNDCRTSDCGNTSALKWVKDNAHKFGFILRYDNNEDWTGYADEFWHFRYVGVDVATKYKNDGATSLEQFLGLTKGQELNGQNITKDIGVKNTGETVQNDNSNDSGNSNAFINSSESSEPKKNFFVKNEEYKSAIGKNNNANETPNSLGYSARVFSAWFYDFLMKAGVVLSAILVVYVSFTILLYAVVIKGYAEAEIFEKLAKTKGSAYDRETIISLIWRSVTVILLLGFTLSGLFVEVMAFIYFYFLELLHFFGF